MVAGVAVLAGESDVGAEAVSGTEELVEAARVLFVAEAQQDSKRDSFFDQMSAPDRHRGNTDAAADEDRACSVRIDLRRGRERVAEGAGDPDPLPRLQLAEPVGAGADALYQEVEPHASFGGGGLSDRDRPRQEGATALFAPAARSGEHVELARLRLRALAIEQREDPIAAARLVRGDLAEAAAERRRHRGCGSPAALRWISCSERTSASPCLAAAIARAAAVAPVIVVTQ